MAETSTPTVADIDAEIADATAAVENLEERVLDGDSKVTIDTIRKAREKVDFLGLRRRGAERAEAKRAEAEHAAERERQIAEAKATLDRLLAPGAQDPMREAYTATVDAIRNLIPAMVQAFDDENAIKAANTVSPGDERFNSATWRISDVGASAYGKELDWVRIAFEEAIGHRARPAIMGGTDNTYTPTHEWPVHWGIRKSAF